MAATSRKTTAAEKAAPAPVEAEPTEVVYDFDGWDADKEQAALDEVAAGFKYVVVEGDFVGRFRDGKIVRVPLEFDADALDSLDDNAAAVDQLRAILTAFGGEDAAQQILGQSMIQMATFATVYFELVQRTAEQAISKLNVRARLGE